MTTLPRPPILMDFLKVQWFNQVSKSKGIYLFSLESMINSFLKNRMIVFSREIF